MTHPSPFKRLLASLYDSFLILAVVFIATALTLPVTRGEVGAEYRIYMTLYLLAVIYGFYGWFWTHGGQTLGMRVWKQKVVQHDGNPVSWQQAFYRYITALPAWCLFLVGAVIWMLPGKIHLSPILNAIPGWFYTFAGFLWVYYDNTSNNWRDKLSGTVVIVTNNKQPAK